MTFLEAKERANAATANWFAKLVIGAMVAAVFTLLGWTLTTVTRNGEAESRLEGKFDTLTSAVTAFQNQAVMQRSIDEAQTTALGALRNDLTTTAGSLRADLTRIDQIIIDHIGVDREVRREQGVETTTKVQKRPAKN